MEKSFISHGKNLRRLRAQLVLAKDCGGPYDDKQHCVEDEYAHDQSAFTNSVIGITCNVLNEVGMPLRYK